MGVAMRTEELRKLCYHRLQDETDVIMEKMKQPGEKDKEFYRGIETAVCNLKLGLYRVWDYLDGREFYLQSEYYGIVPQNDETKAMYKKLSELCINDEKKSYPYFGDGCRDVKGYDDEEV